MTGGKKPRTFRGGPVARKLDANWLAAQVIICQTGDKEAKHKAWDELSRELWPTLMAMAVTQQRRSWFYNHSWTHAEDAAIHAFTVLFEKVDTITEPHGLLSWLRAVIVNYFRSRVRRAQREISIGTGPGSDSEFDSSWLFDRLRHYDASSMLSVADRLHEELKRLRPDEQMLINERFWHGLSSRDLAPGYGVSRTIIDQRLRRIYTKLRAALTEAGFYGSDERADFSTE
jgi:RNA polymerase sigma factor (sigma-70 family)